MIYGCQDEAVCAEIYGGLEEELENATQERMNIAMEILNNANVDVEPYDPATGPPTPPESEGEYCGCWANGRKNEKFCE